MLLKIALLLSIPKMWNIIQEEHAWGKTSKSVRNEAVFLKPQWTNVHILNQDPQGGELPGDSDTDSLWLGLSDLTDKIPGCLGRPEFQINKNVLHGTCLYHQKWSEG